MTQVKFPVINEIKVLNVSSTAFNNYEYIPSKYTADSWNINPPLLIGGIPKDTKTLAVIVEDPDAPNKTWVHWIVWNIAPMKRIPENSIPGTEGLNDFHQHHYGGPCPPSGIHHYYFKVYALDSILELDSNSTKTELERAMSPHILAFGELIGLYKKA